MHGACACSNMCCAQRVCVWWCTPFDYSIPLICCFILVLLGYCITNQLYVYDSIGVWLNFNQNTQYFTAEAPILQFSENQLPFQFEMHNAHSDIIWIDASVPGAGIYTIRFNVIRYVYGITNYYERERVVFKPFRYSKLYDWIYLS